MKPTEFKLYDIRTHKRYIEHGLLTEEDYQKFLKSLPDDSANTFLDRRDAHALGSRTG